MTAPNIVAALYQFVELPDFREFRDPLLTECIAAGLTGTLLLAEEGINGTVAGSREGIDALRAFLDADGRFDRLEYKESLVDPEGEPFFRMKVKLKREIVTLGVPGISPKMKVGRYVEPEDWNELITDPDTVVIDTRNDYEYEVGTFRGAVNPARTQQLTRRRYPPGGQPPTGPVPHPRRTDRAAVGPPRRRHH